MRTASSWRAVLWMLNYIRYRARETRIVTSEESGPLWQMVPCAFPTSTQGTTQRGYTTGDGEREYGLVQQVFSGFRFACFPLFHFEEMTMGTLDDAKLLHIWTEVGLGADDTAVFLDRSRKRIVALIREPRARPRCSSGARREILARCVPRHLPGEKWKSRSGHLRRSRARSGRLDSSRLRAPAARPSLALRERAPRSDPHIEDHDRRRSERQAAADHARRRSRRTSTRSPTRRVRDARVRAASPDDPDSAPGLNPQRSRSLRSRTTRRPEESVTKVTRSTRASRR